MRGLFGAVCSVRLQHHLFAGQLVLNNILAENFETASLPSTTPEERKRLLSFVVCGGGYVITLFVRLVWC